MRYCPHCGKQNEFSSSACKFCNKSLIINTAASTPKPTQKQNIVRRPISDQEEDDIGTDPIDISQLNHEAIANSISFEIEEGSSVKIGDVIGSGGSSVTRRNPDETLPTPKKGGKASKTIREAVIKAFSEECASSKHKSKEIG